MLLGPTMDSMRSASVMKTYSTLHLRINAALYLTEHFEKRRNKKRFTLV
jgi:methionine-gamma-lyase